MAVTDTTTTAGLLPAVAATVGGIQTGASRAFSPDPTRLAATTRSRRGR